MPTTDPVRRGPRSRDRVLTAAVAVVARRGYRAATIEDVATEAAVAKQTIYRWWPSKTALYVDAYESLVPRAEVAVQTGSLRGDLRALVDVLAERYRTTPADAILAGLVADAQADAGTAEQLRRTYVAPRRSVVGAVLDRAVDRGEICRPEDPDFVSDLFSGAIWFRLLLGEPWGEEFAERLVDAVAASL